MKTIIAGILLATGLAVGAAFVLDNGVQRSAAEHYQSGAVRL